MKWPGHPVPRVTTTILGALVLAVALLALPLVAATLGPPEPMRPLNGGVFNHACAVLGDTLHVVTQKGHDSWTKLQSDGTLGPWNHAANLFPGGGANYSAVASHRDFIYILGGENSTAVWVARAKPDGSLEPWRLTTALPAPRSSGAAVAAAGHLYYLGGQGQRRVFHAPILADGSLGAWQETQKLPDNRYAMQAFAQGGYLYAVGGMAIHRCPVDTVYCAKLKPDGSLEKWRRSEPLPEPRASYGGVLAGEDIFLFGGNAGADAEQTASIVSTTIGGDGHCGDWRALPPAPMAASYSRAACWRDWVYVVGGITLKEDGNTVWNTVWRYHLQQGAP